MENSEIIQIKNVHKSFFIHHEKRDSLFEYLLSLLNSKKYSEKLQVLDDISFSICRGEMFGILGLNGSGKSTLLKIMAKVYSPDKGKVITKGRITPFLELGTGFNGDLTARDNVILYSTLLGIDKKTIFKKIEKIFKFAELENYADIKIKNFSTGMVARLAFSTAMEVDPDILLVDEVLSVGDLTFQEKSFNAFMNFKKQGKTIVFVTHSLQQVKDHCDKALWLHKGKIRAIGNAKEVAEIYEKFATGLN